MLEENNETQNEGIGGENGSQGENSNPFALESKDGQNDQNDDHEDQEDQGGDNIDNHKPDVNKPKPKKALVEAEDDGLNFDLKPAETPEDEAETLDSIRSSYKRAGTIAIKPYINKKIKNMGLEVHGMVVFPGTFQMEDMAALEFRGKTKYLNGLDEFAPSIQKMEAGEAKEAKVRKIRTIVAQLEREKAYNNVDIDDPKFWTKVTTFRPDNKDVWGKMSRKCGNNPIFLDVTKVDDLLTIIAIENGGFPGIAKSYDDARGALRPVKWYLDKQTDTVTSRTGSSRIKNKALAILEELYDENPRKLFFIAKLVDNGSLLYNYGTLNTLIYDNMDSFISGEGVEREVKKASQMFIDHSEMNIGQLKLKAAIKDAGFIKYIVTKGDQMIYTQHDGILLGRNLSEVYEYLNDPVNEKVRNGLVDRIEGHWKK